MKRREDRELDDQVRVIELWMQKFKMVGPGALDDVEGVGGSTSDRVILPDMSNVGVFKGMNQ